MTIHIICRCTKRYQANEKLAGRRFRCSACGEVLTVPSLGLLVGGPIPRPAKNAGGRTTTSPLVKTPLVRGINKSESFPTRARNKSWRNWRWIACVAVVFALVISIAIVFKSGLRTAPEYVEEGSKEYLPEKSVGTRVIIRSSPAGARLKVDGKDAGTAPVELTLQGRGNILAELAGYEDRKVEYESSRVTRDMSLTLNPKPARYNVTLSPPEAELSVEGTDAKVADKVGFRIVEISAPDGKRSFTLRASLKGYKEAQQSVVPTPGDLKTITFRLTPISATYTVLVDPPEARLTVMKGKGTLSGTGRERRLVVSDPQGGPSVVLLASLKWHDDVERTIQVLAGANETLAINLVRINKGPPQKAKRLDGDVTLAVVRHSEAEDRLLFDRHQKIAPYAPYKLASGVAFGEDGKMKLPVDSPGSAWLVAEGGVTWKGVKLEGGKIYQFNENHRPQLEGKSNMSVWISFDQDQEVSSTKNGNGELVYILPSNEKIQLLLPSKRPDGWHLVRLGGGQKLEGWIKGGTWKEVTFMKEEIGPTASTARANSKTDWEEINEQGLAVTKIVVGRAKKGVSVYGGTLASLITQGADGQLQAKYQFDQPGSLWIIAAGGAAWGGSELVEGQIYLLDQTMNPRPVRDEYSAWVQMKEKREVYSTSDGKGTPVATLQPGNRVELLLPAADSNGVHKIRQSPKGPERWIRGDWEKLIFMRRKPGGSNDGIGK